MLPGVHVRGMAPVGSATVNRTDVGHTCSARISGYSRSYTIPAKVKPNPRYNHVQQLSPWKVIDCRCLHPGYLSCKVNGGAGIPTRFERGELLESTWSALLSRYAQHQFGTITCIRDTRRRRKSSRAVWPLSESNRTGYLKLTFPTEVLAGTLRRACCRSNSGQRLVRNTPSTRRTGLFAVFVRFVGSPGWAILLNLANAGHCFCSIFDGVAPARSTRFLHAPLAFCRRRPV